MYDGSDYYLFEELFLRMIGICFIHCHNEQADECLYHLSRCKQDFFRCTEDFLFIETRKWKFDEILQKRPSWLRIKWWKIFGNQTGLTDWRQTLLQTKTRRILVIFTKTTFPQKNLRAKGIGRCKEHVHRTYFYVTMKTGLRSGETLWEQWPQICHHEHYTQVDHAVFVHLEHHHQWYHHQIIIFANIDIWATTTEENFQAEPELRHKDRQYVCELGWTQRKALLLPGSGSGANDHWSSWWSW